MGEKKGERKEGRKDWKGSREGGQRKEEGGKEGVSHSCGASSLSKELCLAGSLSCVITWWGGKAGENAD